MLSRTASRGWALALIALTSASAAPAWAACNANPQARIVPADQTVPETTNGVATVVTLSAVTSNPLPGNPNQVATTSWALVGTAPPGWGGLTNANGYVATFNAPAVDGPLALTFSFTITCGDRTATATTIVNLTDVVVNLPPTAVLAISPSPAVEGETVTLDASDSFDPDGTPITAYAWEQIAGPPVTLAGAPGSAARTFVAENYLDTQTLKFKVTVTSSGGQDSEEKEVSILYTNDPPVASLACPPGGVIEVGEGDPITFDGSASHDPDGQIVSYAWSQDTGPPSLDFEGEIGPTAQLIAPHLGLHQLGASTITLEVTDNAGASDTAECGLVIDDVTAPVIGVPADITEEATSSAGATVLFDAFAQDAVDDEEAYPATCVPPSGDTFGLAPPPTKAKTTTVTCSATDSAGNSDSKQFNVIVQDTTAPTVTVPGAFAVEATSAAGAIANYDASATDIVDGAVTPVCVPPSGAQFPLGNTTVGCTATDARNNASAPKTFVLSVMDTTPPVIAPHGNVGPIEATSAAGAVATYTAPQWTDAVDGSGEATCAPASGATFALGDTTVTCNKTDAHGNAADAVTFTVEVVDTTAPVIAPHGNVGPIEATSAAGAVATYTAPQWTDAVDGSGDATCAPLSGATFALGNTTVTCNRTDAHGNAADAVTFTVEVVDTTAPVIVAHSNIEHVEATGPSGASVVYVAPLWTDAVDGSGSASCAPISGSTFALGTTTVTCNKSDAAGNAATPVTFTIEVVDTTPPSFSAMSNLVLDATSGSGAVGTWTNPTATDLVSGTLPASAVSCTPASGSTFYTGPDTTVTCSATDGAGNTGTTSFTVHVRYVFSGFFRPVDNLPTTNIVKAGQAIPVKFSLGGNQGLAIFESGYPKSVAMNCQFSSSDAIEETVTAGGSTLQYDPTTGQYIYVWKTEKSWAGTCRQLQVKYKDGTTQMANFNFTK